MAVKQWNIGDVLTSPDLNAWAVPRFASKTAQTSRSSTTTLAADPHLVVAVDANVTYQLTGVLDYEADATGDFKIGWTVPSGVAGNWTWAGYTVSDNPSFNGGNGFAATGAAGGAGAGQARVVIIGGMLVTTGTAGNLTLTWAQNISSATATILHQYSYLRLDRVG